MFCVWKLNNPYCFIPPFLMVCLWWIINSNYVELDEYRINFLLDYYNTLLLENSNDKINCALIENTILTIEQIKLNNNNNNNNNNYKILNNELINLMKKCNIHYPLTTEKITVLFGMMDDIDNEFNKEIEQTQNELLNTNNNNIPPPNLNELCLYIFLYLFMSAPLNLLMLCIIYK